MDNFGKTIQIFLPDGSPTGIKIAEITSRTVKAILFPRNKFEEAANRHELSNVGVYFLFGEDEKDAQEMVYIGEAENLFERLKTHNKQKDFWNVAIAAFTSNNSFTKAHVKYLEWFCYDKAKSVDRYKLDQTVPTKSYIPEPVQADIHDYFETMKILLSTLGYPIFEETSGFHDKTMETDSDRFFISTKGITASGEYSDEGLVVLQGSKAALKFSPNFEKNSPGYAQLRKDLIESQVVVEEGGVYVFTKNYIFKSPSGAAAVILGRAANGWTEWKRNDGKTLDEVKRK